MSVHPTILTDLPSDCRILSEEVFGPILSMFTYHDIEEVYQALQKQPKPLALYTFTQDEKFAEDVLANTSSGGASVNGCLQHFSSTGFHLAGWVTVVWDATTASMVSRSCPMSGLCSI